MITTAAYLYYGLQNNPSLLFWLGIVFTGLFDIIIASFNNPEFTGRTDY